MMNYIIENFDTVKAYAKPVRMCNKPFATGELQDLDWVVIIYVAAFYYFCENALFRHNALADGFLDCTALVTFLADLCYFNNGFAYLQACADRQSIKHYALCCYILCKNAVAKPVCRHTL